MNTHTGVVERYNEWARGEKKKGERRWEKKVMRRGKEGRGGRGRGMEGKEKRKKREGRREEKEEGREGKEEGKEGSRRVGQKVTGVGG